MTLDEAIRSRIDRFNRLWINATGHSFEEDEKWCFEKQAAEMPIWEEQINKVLLPHGFTSLDAYSKYVYDENGERIEEIDEVWRARPNYSSLYPYEMYVINEAKRTVEFINTLEPNWWNDNALGQTFSDIEKLLKERGYETDSNHSGNTFSTMMLFVDCLIRKPEIFPYLHGALALLVGDEGYHDDRSDIPNLN